jgi:ribosomal protein S18 acetylase RimI-like enzyme
VLVSEDLLHRLESFYDAVPRAGARAEVVGPLTLFVREGAGWPFYARPSSPDVRVGVEDVRAVLVRQHELGVPRQLEWLDDLTPSMTVAAQEAGLAVQRCPLLVLDAASLDGSPDVADVPGVDVRLAEPGDPDLAEAEAVASVAFAAGIGTEVGEAGARERDAAAANADPGALAELRAAIREGRQTRAVARTADGPVGVGGYQAAGGVAELVGVATLPTARRRGIAAAVAATLARAAIERGHGTVFLSAEDDDVARVYERAGFARRATACIARPAAAAGT